VVGVGVDVSDADAGMVLLESRDGDAGVVINAEATRLRAQRMVQPARDAHRVVHLTGHHEPARGEHPADDAGAGLVHVGEDGIVRGPETILQQFGEGRHPPPGLLDHAHVVEAVDGDQVLIGRGLRGDEGVIFQQSQGFTQFEGETDAQGVEGMVAAEAVVLQGQVVDDGGPAAQGFGGQSTE
jgi:hypothetical protein